jgi:hypothetical protein
VQVFAALLVSLAAWQPAGLQPTPATLDAVLAANAKASGTPDAAFSERREHWTYANGEHRFPVDVAVRGRDVRATVSVGAAQYDAGRLHGVRWRGDGNGIVHGLFADQQGDALDRLPQSLIPFDAADCELAGQTSGADPQWVVIDHPSGELATWFFIDEASGLLVRETTREGSRAYTIAFDRFERTDGMLRPRRWHISDGNRANDLDVSVDAIAPAAVPASAVALPTQERVFAPPPGSPGVVRLPARFNRDRITLDVILDGRHENFILDTGTASITLDTAIAGRFGPVLEHASVPQMSVGPLALDNVSVLTVPIFSGRIAGILGYDFFFGHVVRIDYRDQRVEVLTDAAAAPVFADPKTLVVPANVDNGLPLIHVDFGSVASDAFAVDTGSPDLYALDAFARRYPAEIAKRWTATGRSYTVSYLEGSVVVEPHRIARFAIGPYTFNDTPIGVQIPTDLPNALSAIPFDGIIGTRVLDNFDMYFDYDHARIGLRR